MCASIYGCESKIGTQNGTLVNGTIDLNLRSPGGLILTHSHMCVLVAFHISFREGKVLLDVHR